MGATPMVAIWEVFVPIGPSLTLLSGSGASLNTCSPVFWLLQRPREVLSSPTVWLPWAG